MQGLEIRCRSLYLWGNHFTDWTIFRPSPCSLDALTLLNKLHISKYTHTKQSFRKSLFVLLFTVYMPSPLLFGWFGWWHLLVGEPLLWTYGQSIIFQWGNSLGGGRCFWVNLSMSSVRTVPFFRILLMCTHSIDTESSSSLIPHTAKAVMAYEFLFLEDCI